MAFSQDGRKLAVLYEKGNQATLTTWKLRVSDTTLGEPRQFILPLHPTRPVSRRGLGWLNSYNAWLIMGDLIVNSETGELKGELNPPDFADEWAIDPHTLAYHYRFEERSYLAIVRLGLATSATDPSARH